MTDLQLAEIPLSSRGEILAQAPDQTRYTHYAGELEVGILQYLVQATAQLSKSAVLGKDFSGCGWLT